MARRMVWALIATVALAIGIASVATAHDGGKDQGHKQKGKMGKTLTVVERATTDTVVFNTEPGVDSTGDLLTFSNELFDESNTTKVGTDQGYCTRIVVGKSWECTWTNTLEGGQIVVQGPFLDAGDSTLAITGGTGRYAKVRGSMDLHALDATSFQFTFHLKKS